MNFYRTLFLLFILINTNLLFAQETVTFRTDRDTYIAGESVWIQANRLKSGTSVSSDLSKVIYIEVIDNENAPVKQFKLQTKEGSISTEFELPETLPTGNYVIRGYTKWMRNYNPALYFTKNIAVVNPFSRNSFPKSDNIFNTDTIIFYPEGGKIIHNQNNKLTLQSLDKFGSGKSVSGEIISPGGNVILNIETSTDGFASFNFNLKQKGRGENFNRLSDDKYKKLVDTLLESGINLQLVEENDNSLTFMLSVENFENNTSNGTVHIVSSNGDFIKSYPVLLKDKEAISITKKTIPAGYLSAILINNKGEILSSRYFTTSAKSAESLIVKTDNKSYSPRSRVSVDIKNSGLKNITVSVIKECLLNYKTQIGKTNRPDNIPFQALNKMAKNGTSVNDLLLCFNPFDNVLADAPNISFLPEIKGEIISGTILNTDNRQPIVNKSFILSFVSKYPTISFSRTDSLGKFEFIANRFGEQEIVIQPFSRDTANLNYKVNLDSEYSSEYEKRNIHPLFIKSENIAEINKSIINMQVNALYSPFNAYPVTEKEELHPLCFYGEPEISVLIDKFIELPTMEEIISEIVPVTHISRKKGVVSIDISENESLGPRNKHSFCMVDGVPIRNQNNILKIDHMKVEKIDVINLDYFIRDNSFGKIMSIITIDGDMDAFEFETRLFRQVHKSYSPTFLFNSPDYSVDSIRSSRIPDFRNLLYWNSEIVFNDNNEAGFSFYTSDETTNYAIIVEGINSEGIIEQQQLQFVVTGK